jgi:hypothetical protein
MNWIKLITLALQVAEVELPAIEAMLTSLKGASAAHQATVGKIVDAALTSAAV